MEYTTLSDNFIKTSLNSSIDENKYILCHNLSCLLSDKNGKISINTLSSTMDTLELVMPGIGVFVDKGYIPPIDNSPLPLQFYQNITSKAVYFTYNSFKSGDYLGQVDVLYGKIPTVLAKCTKFPLYIKNMVSIMYFETFYVYTQLLGKNVSYNLVTSDLKRTISNIRWISNEVENTSEDYELIEILREFEKMLQLTLHYKFI